MVWQSTILGVDPRLVPKDNFIEESSSLCAKGVSGNLPESK